MHNPPKPEKKALVAPGSGERGAVYGRYCARPDRHWLYRLRTHRKWMVVASAGGRICLSLHRDPVVEPDGKTSRAQAPDLDANPTLGRFPRCHAIGVSPRNYPKHEQRNQWVGVARVGNTDRRSAPILTQEPPIHLNA
jgi:hypothetical protein